MIEQPTHDQATRQGSEARVGDRMPYPPLTLTVLVPTHRRLRRTREVPVPARVLDLSVTGARLDLTTAPPVQAGARLVVHLQGARGVVVVRHLDRSGATQHCGVEFVRLDDTLRAAVYQHLAQDRSVDQWRWEHPR